MIWRFEPWGSTVRTVPLGIFRLVAVPVYETLMAPEVPADMFTALITVFEIPEFR